MSVEPIDGQSQVQRVGSEWIDPQQQGVAGIGIEVEGDRGALAHASLPIG
jgi:hypothetical protein